jgi:hypothetical protein
MRYEERSPVLVTPERLYGSLGQAPSEPENKFGLLGQAQPNSKRQPF